MKLNTMRRLSFFPVLATVLMFTGCNKHNSAYGAYDLSAISAFTTTGLTEPEESDIITRLDAGQEYIVSMDINSDMVGIDKITDTTQPAEKTDYDSDFGEPVDIFILDNKLDFVVNFDKYAESGHNEQVWETNCISDTADAHLREAYARVKILYEDNQYPVFKIKDYSWTMLPTESGDIFAVFLGGSFAVTGDLAEAELVAYYNTDSDLFDICGDDINNIIEWYNQAFSENVRFINNFVVM